MRQLFVVKSDAVIASKPSAAFDLTNVPAGSLGIFELNDLSKFVSDAKLTKDFGIAYGRPNSQAVVLEVNIDSLIVTKVTKTAGTKFSAKFSANITIPTPVIGKDFTIELVKLDTTKHERREWTATTRCKSGDTAETVATRLQKELAAKVENQNVDVTISTATITATAKDYQPWELIAVDDLYGTKVTTTTKGSAPTCDKAYVQNLASEAAQNRGFNNTLADGATIYPGYPMDVDADYYTLYHLRFKNPRVYGRTRDEAVWQEVTIAVPTANSAFIKAVETAFGLRVD
jgi:hypothetical protein